MLFGNKEDDIAMQGFRNIEENLDPWEKPKKKAAPKSEAEASSKVEEAPVEEVEYNYDDAEAVPEEEYTYDDAEAVPEEEYTYDDYMDPEEQLDEAKEQEIPPSAMPKTSKMPPSENPERDALVEGLCRWGAARAGAVVVIPGWGAVGLIANEVYMIMRIARAYDVEMSTGAATAALSSLGATFIGQTIATLVPFPPLQMPIAITVTYGLGKAVAAWLAAGRPGDLKEFKDVFDRERNNSANNVAEFQNLDCKDIPLGDETKKAPLGARAFDAFGSGLDYTGGKLTDMFGALGTLVADKFEEMEREREEKAAAEEEARRQLPEEEKSLLENVRDNFDSTCDELTDAIIAAATQVGNEIKTSVDEKVKDIGIDKLFGADSSEISASSVEADAKETITEEPKA